MKLSNCTTLSPYKLPTSCVRRQTLWNVLVSITLNDEQGLGVVEGWGIKELGGGMGDSRGKEGSESSCASFLLRQ